MANAPGTVDADYRGPTAVVFGNEAEGLSVSRTGDDVRPIRLPLLGVAGLVLCVGLGFLLTANMASNWFRPNDDNRLDRL